MEHTIKAVLKPLQSGTNKNYYEQVLITVDEYPIAMVHIDTLWPGKREKNFELYDKLDRGESVNVEIVFRTMES